MSFKIQDTIQAMKGLPGKYKRLLLAMAKRAKNDGTNMYASKKTLGELAGVSERTAYRIIPDLVDTAAIFESQTHECSRDDCPKGARHYTGHGNHWTQVYEINIHGLDAAAKKLSEIASLQQESRSAATAQTSGWHDILTCHSIPKWGDILAEKWGDILAVSGVSKWQRSGVSKCQTILVYQPKAGSNENPATLGFQADSGSKEGSKLALPPAADSERQNQPLRAFELEESIKDNNDPERLSLLRELCPRSSGTPAELAATDRLLTRFRHDYPDDHPSELLRAYVQWNRESKKGGLRHADIFEVERAWQSESTRSAQAQWEESQKFAPRRYDQKAKAARGGFDVDCCE